jgi:Protein of unknown function (DUF1592)/Protein of unknown function (DUF1588)/Protein of unknown function (DUF1587)/Protein of unknown function (DUF1595)/Protein of unknown function (DUF1585)
VLAPPVSPVSMTNRLPLLSAIWLLLLLQGCNEHPTPSGVDVDAPAGGAPGSVTPPHGVPPDGSVSAPVAQHPELDVGTKPIHRLSNYEYDNTLRDLLGVELTPGRSFVVEQSEQGFDNLAESLAVGARQYGDYFSAAAEVSRLVVADPVLLDRLLPGATPAACDAACLESFVTGFGLRAFRRPLEQWEFTLLTESFQKAVTLGATPEAAVEQVLRIVLSSPQFLYRFELDQAPLGSVPRALNSYELASRLSYMLWASMPDDKLFELAASNELLSPDVLSAQVDRLLGDPVRSASLIHSFAAQWLRVGELHGHSVDPSIYPSWDPQLQSAMQEEVRLFFAEFLHGDRPFADFLTADINYVNPRLAAHYGFPAPATEEFVQMIETGDQRAGFLGLAGFLTVTSKANRTSPIARGNTVLNALVCLNLELPTNLVVAELPELTGKTTVRQDLELHRANPACSGCHDYIDPLGLALEHFDAIGQYRADYGGGLAIDAVGTLPTGETFDGLLDMSQVLAKDSRVKDCVAQQLFTYGLGRTVGPSGPHLQKAVADWQASAPTLRNLIKSLVRNDTFRFRRGSGEQ